MLEIILYSHLSRYPAMQIQDVYKLLHQAAMGSEHAVSDLESAPNWLKRELAEMGEGPPELLIDPISPEGRIARIHLRPFVAAGHDPDVLLDAFIRTANEHHGDIRLLEQYWQAAITTSKFPLWRWKNLFDPEKLPTILLCTIPPNMRSCIAQHTVLSNLSFARLHGCNITDDRRYNSFT